MLYGLHSNYGCWIQDRTHLSTARFMSKVFILPVSTWNTYNILPTLTSLPKEVLLWARILLVALHMWCLPPSAVCRGMSATVTLIPGKLLVRSWLNYNRNLLNVNANHLLLSVTWYILTKYIYFPCTFFAILHVLLALMLIHCRYKSYSWISLQISHYSQQLFLIKFR